MKECKSEVKDWLSESGRRVVLTIHAVPGAARSGVAGMHGDALKIRIKARPVHGKANKELVEFLAEQLDVPGGSIRILAGEGGRRKRVLIEGVSGDRVRSGLGARCTVRGCA